MRTNVNHQYRDATSLSIGKIFNIFTNKFNSKTFKVSQENKKKTTTKKKNARSLVQLVVFTRINGDSTFATLVKILLIDFIYCRKRNNINKDY